MLPIILAAGKGTRLKSDVPKVLHTVEGKPMIDRILATVHSVPQCKEPLLVVGHGAQQVQAHLGRHYTYVVQEDISGTASAVAACLPHIPRDNTPVLVLYGDQPFVRKETLENIYAMYERERPALLITSLTVAPADQRWSVFSHFGRIVRDSAGGVERIVEVKNATPEEQRIREVNVGIMCAEGNWLAEAILRIPKNSITGEYYLTDLVAMAVAEGKHVAAVSTAPEEALGINSKEDAEIAKRMLTV